MMQYLAQYTQISDANIWWVIVTLPLLLGSPGNTKHNQTQENKSIEITEPKR